MLRPRCALRKWFSARFNTFDLLPVYFTSIAHQWQNILWGGSVVAVIFVIVAATGAPPKWVVMMYLVSVMFAAGYYVWRHDHIRLMPKFGVCEQPEIKPAVDTDTNTGTCVGRSIWIQLVPTCLTNALVENCEGRLLRVLHKWPEGSGIGNGEWEHTQMDEPVLMGWSLAGSRPDEGFGPLTLRPGVSQRLNVCTISDRQQVFIIPCVCPITNHAFDVLTQVGKFRFEVKLSAKYCPDVDVAVEFERGDPWDKPKVAVVPITEKDVKQPMPGATPLHSSFP
jgi:hypothetical protein